MSEIHDIGGGSGEERLRVIFFHGLNGDTLSTWACKGATDTFWPAWLLSDIPGLRASTVEYDASPSRWFSDSPMTVADRATNIASLFASDPSLSKVPLILIGHSLGGILIKAVIRHMKDHEDTNPEYTSILSSLRLVAFLGTPHSGSDVKKIPVVVRIMARLTGLSEELFKDSPILRDLANWYRINAPKSITHIVFTETRLTKGWFKVVSAGSSDPGLPNTIPIPVDANHIDICKPISRNSEVYRIVLKNIESVMEAELPKVLRSPLVHQSGEKNKGIQRTRGVKSRIAAHRDALVSAAAERPFTVLLCGPSAEVDAQAAAVRTSLADELSSDGFDVVLGESAGLTNSRLGQDTNALGRELEFLRTHCNAVVLVARGAGVWTELGLFGWHLANDKEMREKGVDIVLLADDRDVSTNEFAKKGAIAYADALGIADLVDLSDYDPEPVLRRLRARRGMYVMDRRGRPKKDAA